MTSTLLCSLWALLAKLPQPSSKALALHLPFLDTTSPTKQGSKSFLSAQQLKILV